LFTSDLNNDRHDRPQRSPSNGNSNLSSEPLRLVSRPATFLLGLDDIQNLEFLTTKDLLEQIAWNAESQEILTVKDEDLTLLEDLLINFPES